MKCILFTSITLMIFIVLTACMAPQTQPTVAPGSTEPPPANMPNPASVYCEQQGHKLEIRTAADGSQSGVCIFPDASACDEWAFFRGECGPSLASPTPPPTEEIIASGWKTYHNDVMNFSFQYPANATILLDGYTAFVNGPVVNNNSWPVFMIGYPRDREEFRIPSGMTDLRQWLIDHNLYTDQPQADRIIAATTAIHTRFPGSQQAFASDRYHFVHGNQMFMINILHTGNREDWELYNHFLDSFKFEQAALIPMPSTIPTVSPIDTADYQGWWTYTHPNYGFSIMLPEDWVVEEITTFDPLMNGHTLMLHPKEIAPDMILEKQNIRMTFRRLGEDALLWPTGLGEGEFVPQGTLDIAGLPAQRLLLTCLNGDVTSIWYHQAEGHPNITRADMEFGFIYSAGPHCAGFRLSGKVQRVGEMIIASLKVP